MIEVFAELSKKQMSSLHSGESYIEVPSGVTMKHRNKSLTFTCPDEKLAKMVTLGLNESHINWQYNHYEKD